MPQRRRALYRAASKATHWQARRDEVWAKDTEVWAEGV